MKFIDDLETLKLIMDHIEEYIVLADNDLKIVYINKSGPGIPRDEFIGSYLPDMIEETNKIGYMEFIARIKMNSKPQYFTYTSRGGLFLRVRGTQISNSQGEELLLLVNTNLSNFVTRYTQAGKVAKFAYSGTSALILTDETTQILSTSPELIEYTNFKGEIGGTYLSDYILDRIPNRNIHDLMEKQMVILKNFDSQKDNIMVKIDIQETILNKKQVWLVNFIPISNMIALNQEERRINELFETHKLQSLGYLSSKIAHDFNNILTAINGTFYIIDENIRKDELKNLKFQLEGILSRGKSLTDQLLLYSARHEDDEIIHLNAINELKSMKTLLSMVARDHKLEFLYQEIECDPIRMKSSHFQQLMMNLVSNAVDATEPGGKITIGCTRTSNLDPQNLNFSNFQNPSTSYCEISVKDTGKGIHEQEVQRMFEPYFSTKAKGRGLGLSIILDIVRNSQGAISVKSEPGIGTEILLYFPFVQ